MTLVVADFALGVLGIALVAVDDDDDVGRRGYCSPCGRYRCRSSSVGNGLGIWHAGRCIGGGGCGDRYCH